MHFAPLLKSVGSMFDDFRLEITKLRAAGATQADIDMMIDKFNAAYATEDDEEGILVVAVLREAAKATSLRSKIGSS